MIQPFYSTVLQTSKSMNRLTSAWLRCLFPSQRLSFQRYNFSTSLCNASNSVRFPLGAKPRYFSAESAAQPSQFVSKSSKSPTPPLIRGCHDIFEPDLSVYSHIESEFSSMARRYNYDCIRTPILESSALFERSLGAHSDIVHKEMFIFEDHGVKTILRPEATASTARAIIQQGIQKLSPMQRVYYHGPMFRRERPQKGRYRQFQQFGVELINSNTVLADIEVIEMAYLALEQLQLAPYLTLQINTLGDEESRHNYTQKLKEFLHQIYSKLSTDSKLRYDKGNFLRILDSKDAGDIALLRDEKSPAPTLKNSLNEASLSRFTEILTGLKRLQIPYEINPFLVRGLDYYCHTAFEFVVNENINNAPASNNSDKFANIQNTRSDINSNNNNDNNSSSNDSNNYNNKLPPGLSVLAGGRYDTLFSDLGGPFIPAIGFAAGVDRLVLLHKFLGISLPQPCPLIAVVAIHDNNKAPTLNPGSETASITPYSVALQLCQSLRRSGFHVVHSVDSKVNRQFQAADRSGAILAIIVGSEETAEKKVKLKNMKSGVENAVLQADLQRALTQLILNQNKPSKDTAVMPPSDL
jgi:histidyl-tRNA synthetase